MVNISTRKFSGCLYIFNTFVAKYIIHPDEPDHCISDI